MGTLEGNKDRAVQLLQNKLTLTKQEVFFKSFGIAIPSNILGTGKEKISMEDMKTMTGGSIEESNPNHGANSLPRQIVRHLI